MARLKPTTPLLAPNKAPLKPASPLRPKTAPNTAISHLQRRWRFQSHTDTSEQRRRRFQTTGPPHLQHPHAVPAGGPGCGTRGRWRGLAGQRADAPSRTSTHQAPLVWRVPEGPEGPGCSAHGRWRGLAGLRDDAPSQGLAARTARGRNAAHGHTKQPGPLEQDARRPEHPWGRKQPGPAGRTNHNLRNWAASRPTARSARNAILKSPGHPQCRRRSAPRAYQEKPR